jgi:prephenate dehydrogenase
MPEKLQITIVGLGLVGASAGMALHRHAERLIVVGHDKDAGAAGRARSMGAVDRTEWNLISAVRHADRILLALPVSEIKATLVAMAGDLKPGCVIVDTATLKAPVLAWAAESLPAHASLIGGDPILVSERQGTANAKADLFSGKPFCLVADAGAQAQALQMATDLVEALGARPFFVGAEEHDGLLAAVEHLPALLAAALCRAVSGAESWQEMRKLAGSQFYASSYIVESDAQALAGACLANGANLSRWLDNLIVELGQWKEMLEPGDQTALAAAFEDAMQTAARWSQAQATNAWDDSEPLVEMPSAGSEFRRLLGFGGRGESAKQPRKKQ